MNTTTETFTLQRHRRTFTLDDGRSTLHLGRAPKHGDVTTAAGTWPVRILSFRGLAAEAGDFLRLHPKGAVLPDGPARWTVHRHSAELSRGGARIVVRESGWFRKTATVEVTGAWADLDLVVLTACFAVLARQRRRVMLMTAVAASNHG
ncbi:hypothetical protein [Cryptosporangium sp. NPDC051539]|uniref:hypothetical protein n=1 Tax=Cryptosporangium sp. NPDC051539 TaxID=3363962 RepID=UPI00379A032C